MPEPRLPDSFEWMAGPGGRVLRCRPLADVAPHLFTTRELPLSGDHGNGADGWRDIARALGLAASGLVRLAQVHGARVVAVPDEAHESRADGTWADADGAVTADPALALVVKVADCVPVLIGDARTGAVAAVHAGWRGLAAGVVQAAVRSLASRFQSSPADLVAALGPSIGPCCYQVGTDVADRLLDGGAAPADVAEWFAVSPGHAQAAGLGLGAIARADGRAEVRGKLWLDTWRASADQLAAAGIARARIHAAGLCTACYPGLLHSYRIDGPRAGRMAGVIRPAARSWCPESETR